jgi:hypothetical protein
LRQRSSTKGIPLTVDPNFGQIPPLFARPAFFILIHTRDLVKTLVWSRVLLPFLKISQEQKISVSFSIWRG